MAAEPKLADQTVLIVAAADSRYALRLADVVETLRPLKLSQLPELPPFVLGASVIRGSIAPVIDLCSLLTGVRGQDQRWVSLRCGERLALLSVDAVHGLSSLPADSLQALPSLLDRPANPVASLHLLDRGLLAVLDAGRLLPAAIWSTLDDRRSPQ